MAKWYQAALEQRRIIDRLGAFLSDAQALEVMEAYPLWEPGIEISQAMIDSGMNRYRLSTKLYKTETPHTTQNSWAPIYTPALWTPLNPGYAGTLEEPIPAQPGLMYKDGLYYIDAEGIYICTRQDTPEGTALYHSPSELIGQYFAKVMIV